MSGTSADERWGTLDAPHRTVRFSRRFAHPIDRVWVTVTDPVQLAAWFPQRVVGDLPTPGAPLRFESTTGDHAPFEGSVVDADPPHRVGFTWGSDVIRFELEPAGEGCVFVLTDEVDALGHAARDAAGWHTCLDFLAAHLDGADPSFTTVERWTEVHPHYVEGFGPEASTIGPPDSFGE
ncbi:MAG TPA: SRPBCC family protein [Acidimicrobiales bacterium]|nr:SRPBCC family protein [Acidimicrobiales bacterium]